VASRRASLGFAGREGARPPVVAVLGGAAHAATVARATACHERRAKPFSASGARALVLPRA
jgi:hypothetical protein